MQILVVEDDSSARTGLVGILQQLGHDVTEASDGEGAWELYRKRDFGLVIADWVLPGMNGPELCQRIREEDRPRYTYVMVLSALREGRVSYLEAMDSGADDFVTKPVGIEDLAARIRVAERMGVLRREVQTLRGLLPICSYCRKIRTDQDAWSSLEAYVASHSDVVFSHGICPECYESTVAPDLESFPGEG